jgi:hypothetical protein
MIPIVTETGRRYRFNSFLAPETIRNMAVRRTLIWFRIRVKNSERRALSQRSLRIYGLQKASKPERAEDLVKGTGVGRSERPHGAPYSENYPCPGPLQESTLCDVLTFPSNVR